MSSGWKGVLESFRPFLVDAMGRSQQGSDHHAPVAAVTPDHDIGDDPPGEIIVILEGKVESSGKGLVNVAGRAENLTDDVLVRPHHSRLIFDAFAGGKTSVGGRSRGCL